MKNKILRIIVWIVSGYFWINYLYMWIANGFSVIRTASIIIISYITYKLLKK